MDKARAQAGAVTLDVTLPDDDVLPPFFHQFYFWEPMPAEQLGRDGHPKVGGLIPDMGLPRRMWAGGRLKFSEPLRTGLPAVKRTVCEAANAKQGRSGPLAFVTLRHEIWQADRCCVTEWQDLVYREDPDPKAPGPKPPTADTDAQVQVTRGFTSTQLFRYSALTFNGHRIHYDLDYARDVEGYAGLVVHGPMLAQYLMLLAEAELGPLATFSFRATSPLMHFEQAQFCLRGRNLWVAGPDGRQCMQAEASER